MNRQVTEALIVTRSLVLQQGLAALLESLPEIMKVTALTELPHSYAWIETHRPRMVLLDSRIAGDNTKSVLARIQEISPETCRVLLVDDVQEVNGIPHDADAILIKGIPPQAVASLLSYLLIPKGDENGHNDPIP